MNLRRECTGRSAHARRRQVIGRAARFELESCEARLLLTALPEGTRGWETVPGVIRNDGIDSFVVEIEPGAPVESAPAVSSITFSNTAPYFVAPPSNVLLDDGAGADRVAGDGIYTSGAFRYDADGPFGMPDHYNFDEDSPAGLFSREVASFTLHHTDGSTSRFLGDPAVGLLDKDIPAVQGTSLAPGIVATPHLVNIQSENKDTQKFIRSENSDLEALTKSIYDVLGDDYDFLMFLSTYKVEGQEWLQRENFTAGMHSSVQVNFTGTGQGQYDLSDSYGSDGRLLGINILDTYDRGMLSYNAVHEMLHQWGAFTSPALRLADGGAHYNIHTSVGSILGGKMWSPMATAPSR